VLAGARELLAEAGLPGFSIPALALRLGFPRASVYNFFPTPPALFTEVGRAGLLGGGPFNSCSGLRARADGLVPLGRPSFEVENEGVVHKPPPFGIRAAFGVELNFL